MLPLFLVMLRARSIITTTEMKNGIFVEHVLGKSVVVLVLILSREASKQLESSVIRSYYDQQKLVCMCLQTQSMMELNQKFTKSMATNAR